MARKSLKEFKKLYNAHFLTTSLSTYKVGHKIDWDGIFHNRLDVDQYYFTSLFPGMTADKKELLNSQLDNQNEKILPAQITAVDIERKQDIDFALKIPMWALDLSTKLDFDKVLHFSYENVEAKSLFGDSMSSIIQYVLSLAPAERKHVDHIRFFKVLYYSDSISMTFSNDYAVEAKAIIQQMNIEPNVSVSGINNEKITLKGAKHSPFAAVIESVGDLLD